MSQDRKPILGVVGGIGPRASAEFLDTVYRLCNQSHEQDTPIVLLTSDPTFPDRTEAFLNGRDDEVLERLIRAICGLQQLAASRVVICCVTMHHLLPRLPHELRTLVISLIDVVMEEVSQSPERSHLLLCSSGTRSLGLFEKHPRWPELKRRFVLPDEREQKIIHQRIIYGIKSGHDPKDLIPLLDSLRAQHGVRSFIAACTEIHILVKSMLCRNPIGPKYSFVDPLMTIAQTWLSESL